MSVSRKCPQCQEWNTDHNVCVQCGTTLNTDELRKEREAAQLKKHHELNTDRIDAWIAKLSESKNMGGRLMYFMVRSVWFVVFMMLTFIYAVIAFIAG